MLEKEYKLGKILVVFFLWNKQCDVYTHECVMLQLLVAPFLQGYGNVTQVLHWFVFIDKTLP